MKLYRIKIRHCAPRDCKEFLVGFVLAEDEESIYEYIDKELLSGIWSDRNQDSLSEPLPIEIIENDERIIIGYETYKEKMLRIRGEYYDKFLDYSDAYYGITHYGWTQGVEVSEDEIQTLLHLGICIDLRKINK